MIKQIFIKSICLDPASNNALKGQIVILNERVQNLAAESKRLREANDEKESLIEDLQKKLHSFENNKTQVCRHIQQIVEGNNKKFDTFDITRGVPIYSGRGYREGQPFGPVCNLVGVYSRF